MPEKAGGDRVVCGRHAVEAALRNGGVRQVVAVRGTNEDIQSLAEGKGHKVRLSDRRKVDGMAGGARHQGIVAVCRPAVSPGWRVACAESPEPLLLVLDQVVDPHNLGACVRTAAAMAADAVVIPRKRSSPMTAAASKAASGGEEAVPVESVTNLARELRAMRGAGLFVVGCDQEAPASVWDFDATGPVAVVLGGEERGMRRLTKELCDALVSIPMPGRESVASLNVSVSCGIMLFVVRRLREQAVN